MIYSPQVARQNEESMKGKGTTSMEFMVSVSFRPQDQAEILARMPQEPGCIRTLREAGTVKALYISSDRSPVWIVRQGGSEAQVQKGLESLPLSPYMEVT